MQQQILMGRPISTDMPGEVLALLAKKYTIPILSTLKIEGAMGFRKIDVKVIGGTGSVSSTSTTLSDLISAGWVGKEGSRGKYFITPRGLDVLAYSEQGESRFSIIKAEKPTSPEYWMALNDFELNVDRFGIRDILDRGVDIEALFHRSIGDLKLKLGKDLDKVKWEVEQFRGMDIESYSKLRDNLSKEGVRIIKYSDDRYPQSLKKSENHHPLVLYHKGSLLDFSNCVAIVGARHPSSYTREKIRKTSQALAREGYTIVSGLALGTDTEAHRGALDVEGRTIAVIPNIGKVTPSSNLNLAEAITEKGAVIGITSPLSDLPKAMWVRRNKVISGLSKCLCAAVSTESKGTFHQVNFALKQGLKVFALKPPSDDHLTYLAFRRLAEMGATPFSSENEILTYLGNSP